MALKLKIQIYDDEAVPPTAQNLYSIDMPLGDSLPEGIRDALNHAIDASAEEVGAPTNSVTSMIVMAMVMKGLVAKLPGL